MSKKRVRLPSGVEMSVVHLEPPVPAALAEPVADLVVGTLNEGFLPDLLRGRWSQELCSHLLTGHLAGDLAGTCWTAWGRAQPDLGVVGGVVTKSPYRRRGIASHLCAKLCDIFDRAGGRLLYLAAATDAARSIYEKKLGFRPVVGRILCRSASGACPEDGFAPGQAVHARVATWGDLGAIVPLCVFPHPCVLVNALTRFPSTRIEGPARCVGIFWNVWRATVERGGQWHVLENERGRLVASAVAAPGSGEACNVDFIWHPHYEREGAAFVLNFLAETAKGGACRLQVCENDEWKLGHAAKLGFGRPVGSGGETIELDGRRLRVLTCFFHEPQSHQDTKDNGLQRYDDKR